MNLRRVNHRCHQLGFTLLELMVVIVLIGIMSAMIIPAMHGTYEDALLRSTARKLVDVFQLANSRAVALNRTFAVRLDTKAGKFSLQAEKATLAGSAPQLSPFEGSLDTRITIEMQKPDSPAADEQPVEPTNSNRDDRIFFYPDGTADDRQLLLRDRQGFELGLRINPITARVHLVEQARK